jgi:uncharacterized protein (TIGR00255 family)
VVKSMTGYGRGEYQDDAFSFIFELKTVNHRYAEVAIRLPRFLNPLENRIRQTVLKRIARGHVDVFITASYTGEEGRRIKIDKGLVKAYHESLKDTADLLGIGTDTVGGERELYFISNQPDVLTLEEAAIDPEALWLKMEPAINEALDHCDAMREAEGANISRDVANRVDLIEEKLGEIEKEAPQTVVDYEAKLTERIQELLDKNNAGEIDQSRLIQEVAIYSDHVNITEEIVRLHSHIKQFREMLASAHPVGRRMDFLVQEFNREANTIASKANDSVITQTVVDMKGEIEKVREQIQNIQ